MRSRGLIAGHDYTSVFGGVTAAVDRFCREHGQTLHVVTDEAERPVPESQRQLNPWLPRMANFNSFAVVVGK